MAGMIAIGVGCRRGCDSAEIVGLIRRALTAAGELPGKREMFTIEGKRGEPNLEDAARSLDLTLHFLAHELLASQAPRVATRSARVERQTGLPGVAETAALAGAGPGGELVVARMASDGATCAIAFRREAAK